VRLAIIAAVGHRRAIGKDGKLPWHIPEDLKRFQRLTMGHALLMGRGTWESLGRALPGRRNVVLSSSPLAGIESYDSIEQALRALSSVEKVFVIGGGKVYAQLIDRADEIYLTVVDRDVEADTFFPPYEHLLGTRYRETAREHHPEFEFIDYART
jgi:dihydrofolate reductase